MATELTKYTSLEEHVVALITEKNSKLDNAILMVKVNQIIAKTPKVASLPANIIAGAVLKAMIPDPTLQNHMDIYFVPFNGAIDVSFSHNYLQKLAYSNGAVRVINTYLVYESDIVEFTQNGLNYKIMPFQIQGDFLGVLVDIKLANGEHKYGTVTKDHIEEARKASKSQNGPWKKWYFEMARKVGLKNTMKGIDISKEFADAVAIDNEDTNFTNIKDEDIVAEKANMLEDAMRSGSNNLSKVEDMLLEFNVSFKIIGDWVMMDEDTVDLEPFERFNLVRKEGKDGKLFGKVSKIAELLLIEDAKDEST